MMSLGTSVPALEALSWVAGELSGVVPTPMPEAETLLCHVLDCSRSALYGNPDRELDDEARAQLNRLVDCRRGLQPLQYLTGVQAFRSLALAVGPGVLIPRPETEMVVEQALELLEDIPDPWVADVGTGSGAIALSLGIECPDSRVWATDISEDALRWARLNWLRYRAARVELVLGDLFDPLPESMRCRFDLVVSNPPYLSESEFLGLPYDVRNHEPKSSLVAGEDGTEVSTRLVHESIRWLKPGGWLVLETTPDRWDQLGQSMASYLDDVGVAPDLTGRLRIAQGRKR
jgi:release factor glutamine methyltransferase